MKVNQNRNTLSEAEQALAEEVAADKGRAAQKRGLRRFERDETPALQDLLYQMNQLHARMGGRDGRPERKALLRAMKTLQSCVDVCRAASVEEGAQMSGATFGKQVPLERVLTRNAETKALYGTTDWEVDRAALSRCMTEAGIQEGFEDALAEVEARLERLQLNMENN